MYRSQNAMSYTGNALENAKLHPYRFISPLCASRKIVTISLLYKIKYKIYVRNIIPSKSNDMIFVAYTPFSPFVLR
jgi:hypothetical protein